MRPDAEYEEVDRLVRWGMSDHAIAQTTRIPKPTVRVWRKRGHGSLRGPIRSQAEFDEVDRFIRWGLNNCQISRLTGIPLSTVWRWRREGFQLKLRGNDCGICGPAELDPDSYSYLLGLYLGDGCISSRPRGVFNLEIALDKRYPGIIDECRGAIGAVRSSGRMSVGTRNQVGCVIVWAYWKHWPCLFPQHGPGPKHLRPIQLDSWQQDIVAHHPERILRGLIHSDGCRVINRVKVGGRRYEYPRYQFTNNSEDIKSIFCRACDDYGVSWRQSNWKTISVSRAADVAKLDEVIGPKT
jgi:hypothetical protein